MSSATAADQPLVFAKSSSESVGLGGRFMDMMRSNAPRIVGTLKFVGDSGQLFVNSPLMVGTAVLSMIGRTILMAYGTKENQKKQIEKARLEHENTKSASMAAKVVQPKKYPVESSTALSIVAEMLTIAYGVVKLANPEKSPVGAIARKGLVPKGLPSLIVGVGSLLSYGYLLFAKESDGKDATKPTAEQKDNPDLVFDKSKSEHVGAIGKIRRKLKDNPVLVSSLVSFGISSVNFFGGMLTGEWGLTFAGGCFMCANAIQAVFVRKKDFNIEGAQEEQGQTASPAHANHVEKITKRRQDAAKDSKSQWVPVPP